MVTIVMKKNLFFLVACGIISLFFISCEKPEVDKCWEVDATSHLLINGEELTSMSSFIYLWCKESEIDAEMEAIRLEQIKASEEASGMSFEENGFSIVFDYTYKESMETTEESCEELNG